MMKRLNLAAWAVIWGVFFFISCANAQTYLAGLTANSPAAAATNTAIINAAIQRADNLVALPPGEYYVNSLLMNQSGVRLMGTGEWATTLHFVPTGSATAVAYSGADPGTAIQVAKTNAAAPNILYNSSIEQMAIKTTDTTYTKIAIRIAVASNVKVSHVLVTGFVGGDSVGLQTMGHEQNLFEDVTLGATVPLRISPSPATFGGENFTAGHFVFRDMFLLSAGTPATLPHTDVLIDSGTFLTTVMFEGAQAWVGGKYGLYWVATSNGNGASYQLSFKNVRVEQGGPGAIGFYINFENTTPPQNIYFENCNVNSGYVGWYLRNLQLVELVNSQAAVTQSGGRVVDVAGTYEMEWRNMYTQQTDTANITGFSAGAPYNSVTRPAWILPVSGTWR
jgi:hypothetical protein